MLRSNSSAFTLRSLEAGPTNTISAPSASVAAIFTFGALSGITITAFEPNARAAYATPCAWFPLEYVITPRDNASGESCATVLYAPRSLKLPIAAHSHPSARPREIRRQREPGRSQPSRIQTNERRTDSSARNTVFGRENFRKCHHGVPPV